MPANTASGSNLNRVSLFLSQPMIIQVEVVDSSIEFWRTPQLELAGASAGPPGQYQPSQRIQLEPEGTVG